MPIAFAVDPAQRLSEGDELDLVRRAADMGYASAWTPSGPDAAAFDRCIRWHVASRLPVGISVVPASDAPAVFYAEHARRAWEETSGHFTLGVGSGRMQHAAEGMRRYLRELRERLPPELPVYVAALGPLMLDVAGEMADGAALNWSTPEQVAWSRRRVEAAARGAGRPMPVIVGYIRTAVDPEPDVARSVVGRAVRGYALGPGAYRRHFERMGFGEELRRVAAAADPAAPARSSKPEEADWSAEFLSATSAWGRPGEVRVQVERLSTGLDLPIVRVLVARPGDAASARLVLEECAPAGAA
ncbi:MAG: LLM class flavin-dependent oxidoreductase [Chloroflexi bacterium]|nr:LLM class flavin-dependent oxidoreductase [Chloroflexota bacterium]